ncbi:aminoglycoside phosphotransferase family protein [Methylogaea oryzae]|uniref:Phosphotransferase n=1 Tax=Methylogaea oryzae TaxID=1295382 RepID=A0A8D4VSV3_9GAMM|nr:phosphotransferase [Methylogaea oryzae]BBL71899.1 phosphotransferase [Methylogaea oryzae]
MTESAPSNASDARYDLLNQWLTVSLKLELRSLAPASSDASFRRYFRAELDGRTYIAMDAPPPLEDVRPFLRVAELMSKAGVKVPGVHAADVARGFLLLEDFGSEPYLDRLHTQSADALYGDALDALFTMQSKIPPAASGLPEYHDGLLQREFELFRDWFLQRLLGIELSSEEQALLDDCCARLIANALEQPTVVVHRDYHSRNLMVTENGNPGVLDFQDAVTGPITYDAVSLLRDCYVDWPLARVETWALNYAARLRDAKLLDGEVEDEQFLRWFDLMGMQRHLKAIGIFSRLKLRDGKSGYLQDIPRTLNYVLQSAGRYDIFAPFVALLEQHVVPRLDEVAGGAQ